MKSNKLGIGHILHICIIIILACLELCATTVPLDLSDEKPLNDRRHIQEKLDKVNKRVDNVESNLSNVEMNVIDNTKNIKIFLNTSTTENRKHITSVLINMKDYQKAKHYVERYLNDNTGIENIVNEVFNNNSHTQLQNYQAVLNFADFLHSTDVGPQGISLKLFVYDSLNTDGRLPTSLYIRLKTELLHNYKTILNCSNCTNESKYNALNRIKTTKNQILLFGIQELINKNSHATIEESWFAKLYSVDQELARDIMKQVIAAMYSQPNIDNILSKINKYSEKIPQILGYIYTLDELLKQNEINDEIFKYAMSFKNFTEKCKPSHETELIGQNNWNKLIREMKSYTYRIPECPRNLAFAKYFRFYVEGEPINIRGHVTSYDEKSDKFEIEGPGPDKEKHDPIILMKNNVCRALELRGLQFAYVKKITDDMYAHIKVKRYQEVYEFMK